MTQIVIDDALLEQWPTNGSRTCGRVSPNIDCFFLNQTQYDCPREDDLLLCRDMTCFIPVVDAVTLRLEGKL